MPKPPTDGVRTTVYLSPEADDIRLWLAIERFRLSLNQVHDMAIRDLGYKSGYDPNWKDDPRSREKIKVWLQTHVGRPRTIPILQEVEVAEEQIEDEHQERNLEEVYA